MEKQQTPSSQVIESEYVTPSVMGIVKHHIHIVAPLVASQWVSSAVANRILNAGSWSAFLGIRSLASGTTSDEKTTINDAEDVYGKMTKILGYITPVLLFGKWYIQEFNVVRPTVDHAPDLVKFTTRYHFVVAGSIILLQNLMVRNFELVQGLQKWRFVLDTLLAVGAGVQVIDKLWFWTNRD